MIVSSFIGRSLLTILERTAKALPVLLGSAYVLGFLFTAARLNEFNVPTIRLLDFQYFAAGFIQSLLLWTAILAFFSGLRFKPGNTIIGLSRTWIVALVAFVGLGLLLVGLLRVSPISSPAFAPIVEGAMIVLFTGLSIFAVWLWTAAIRNWKMFRNLYRQTREPTARNFAGSILAVSTISALILCGCTLLPGSALFFTSDIAIGIYETIPQAYGGGKPVMIELLVESSIMPWAITDEELAADAVGTAWTVPMVLIHETVNEFVLLRTDLESCETLVLDADSVHAFRILPTRAEIPGNCGQ